MKKLVCIILLFLLLTANVGQAQFNDSEPTFGQQLDLGHWSTDGLVFYWRGIRDKKAVDESLYRNHGTITGATWVGGYLDFTGVGTRWIDIGTSLFFAGWSQFTVVMRVHLDTVIDNAVMLGAWDATTNRMVLLRTELATSNLEFFTFTGAGQQGGDTGFDVVTGEFMHIAIVYDGVVQTLYFNGVAQATPVAQTGAIQSSIVAVRIADDIGTSGVQMDGRFSVFSIYDRYLSASEIQQLYINPDLPMQQDPIWLMYSPAAPPSGIVPIIQAHTRRRLAG